MLHELFGISGNRVRLNVSRYETQVNDRDYIIVLLKCTFMTHLIHWHRMLWFRPPQMNFMPKICILIMVKSYIYGNVFFLNILHVSAGDLGLAMNKLVDDFQVRYTNFIELEWIWKIHLLNAFPWCQAISKFNKQLDSIEDMQRFVENFPEFRQQSGNVSKHISLMSEASAARQYISLRNRPNFFSCWSRWVSLSVRTP